MVFGIGRLGSGFGGMGRIGGSSVAPYLGFVGTRAQIAQSNQSSLHYGNSRSWHFARDAISKIAIILPNYYNPGSEGASGGTITYTASVEYPADNFTQIKWSGATSIAVLSGQQALSDLVTLSTPIPAGAMFWLRNFQVAPTQLLYSQASAYTPNGDALEYSATIIADKTLTAGALVNGGGGGPLFPVAILGMTRNPSVLLIGDSRMIAGNTDTPDATGDQGEVARSIGPSFGYSNMGCSGESAVAFAANTQNANRLSLGAYCTHVLFGYPVNDIQSGTTLAAIKTAMQTNWAKYPGKKIGQITCAPKTASSDAWATLGNQTAAANFPLDGTGVRDGWNAFVLTTPAPLWASFDTALAVETGANNDFWKSPGFTADGLHPTATGYIAEKNSGAINPALFHYP